MMKITKMFSPKLATKVHVCFLLFGSHAHAWEYTPVQPCILTHETDTVAVKLTYDPTQPLYTLALTQKTPFTPAATFSMQFDGPMPIRIATDRHQLSADGLTVSVADSGFGNVLNGLQFNQTAVALLGAQRIEIPLAGAAGPTAAFRACAPVAGA